MRTSNRVRRNISLTLVIVGLICIVSRAWDVIVDPHSGKAWFDLCSIVFLTALCFDSYRIYRRRLARGILFGGVESKQ